DGYDNIISIRDGTLPNEPQRSVYVKYIDSSYLETYGIHLRAGRGFFVMDDAGAPAVGLINAAAERLFFPDGGALGRRLDRIPKEQLAGPSITVVGLLP